MVQPPWLGAEIGDALADLGARAYVLDGNGVASTAQIAETS